MSSVLDALTSEQAEAVEAIVHRRGLERELTAHMLEGLLRRRLTRTFPVASPAAGAEVSTVVPGGTVWELVSVGATLVASAVVANRRPALAVSDQDGNRVARVPGVTQETASNTWQNYWTSTVTAPFTFPGSPFAIPLPCEALYAGWTLATSTNGLDVGDQYSAVVVSVVELSPLAIVRECRHLLDDLDSAGGIRYGSVR